MNRLIHLTLAAAIAGAGIAQVCRAEPSESSNPSADDKAQAELRAARERVVEGRALADQERAIVEAHAAEAREQARELRTRLRATGGVRVEVKKEKVAYLGVSTSAVPAALREQMRLQRGFGLVVDTVEPDSAAGEAGVQQYDILQKLDDQLLVNTQQLGVLVRSMKSGESVNITLLRAGKPVEVTAKLKEKEVPMWSDSGSLGATFSLDAPAMVLAPTEAPLAPLPTFPQVGKLNIAPDGQVNAFRFFGDDAGAGMGQSIYRDSDMTLTITQDDEERKLVAKDNDSNEVLFEGAITSEAQREKLPKKVAEKLKKFESRLDKVGADRKKSSIRIYED